MSEDLIQIKFDERRVAELLGRLFANGQDMSTPFRQIAGVMMYAVEKNFAQEGRPKKWKASGRPRCCRIRSPSRLPETRRLAAPPHRADLEWCCCIPCD